MTDIALIKINDGIYELYDPVGLHVGNFKRINGQWKFKAIGYGPSGELLPGGGPLTDRHNTPFTQLDTAQIKAQFFEK